MLNMVTKKVKNEVKQCGDVHCIAVWTDWTSLKRLIGCMKRTTKNAELLCGLDLVQHVKTRFGIACDVTKKFVKSASHLFPHLDESITKEFAFITVTDDHLHSCIYSYLLAFVNFFKQLDMSKRSRKEPRLQHCTSYTLSYKI